jgi:hypothetical protein
MRGLANDMAIAGHPLGDEELISYILASLNENFNPMVLAVVARVESISPVELYSKMFSHELRHDHQSTYGNSGSYSSANVVVRGQGCPSFFNGHGRGHGGCSSSNTNNSRSSGQHSVNSSANRPHCQVCLRSGHMANICWYMFNEEYIPDQKTIAAASTMHSTDPNWYLHSGTTNHITGEMDKLTMHHSYHGHDQVRTANDTGMPNNRVGTSIIPTPSCDLHLTNVLHVPRTHKHLIFVHHFNHDNHAYIELHPYFFLIEDQVMRRTLL